MSSPVKSEMRDGMQIDWDVPITMDDGLVLRCDVFRPVAPGHYPVLLSYGPYAKGLAFQEGYPSAWQKMVSDHPDVPYGSSNLYQNWEVVDPEKWVPDGYVCVRVDSRGCGRSPGYVDHFSPRETQDFYQCIEWAGVQPWSNGKVGLPVRVQWSRREELSQSPMGSASVIELQADLDNSANLIRWQADVWSHTHLARPGWGAGVQLLGAWSLPAAAPRPADQDVPLPTGGGLRNAVPEYRLPALRVNHHFVPEAPLRVSALRSLGAHANVFAIESFIDELCEAAEVDALQFRLRHLDDPRARAVLQRVGELCDWSERSPAGIGSGLGLGYARYKNRAGYCAVAMQVDVAEQVHVRKVWACVDAGRIIHRDGLLNQIEGGVIQALSWSLKESVQWDASGITSNSWESYPILSFQDIPEIDIELIDQPHEPALGSGEVVTGPCAAALGNDIAHALGLRVRDLPFTPERLLQAIHHTQEETP